MKDRLRFLDSLRGLAAIYVVIGHARWLLWEGYSIGFKLHMEHYSTLEKCFVYFLSIFKFGHEAVIFFFVLSGFVIHLNYIDKLGDFSKTRKNILTFYFKRFKRIYPALIVALLFTFICDVFISIIYPEYLTSSTEHLTLNEFISFNHGKSAIIGGFLNLGGLGMPIFGSNGPLWSLSYEWWFYMFYPFLYFRVKTKSIVFYLVIFTLAFLSSFNIIEFVFLKKVFIGLASWSLGCILAEVFLKRAVINLFQLITTLFAVLIIHLKYPVFGHDFTMAIVFTILIGFCLRFEHKVNKIFKLQWLGEVSYTLYIFHFPLLIVFSAVLLKMNNGKLPMNQFYIILGVGFSLLLALLIAPFLEQKIPKLIERFKTSV